MNDPGKPAWGGRIKRRIAKIRSESGQAMVEMAICLPILLLVVMGICDFGWIYYNQMNVANAAREGARYAIVNEGMAGLAAEVVERAEAMCAGSGEVSVTVNLAGGDVVVTVTQQVRVLTPLAGIFTQDQTLALTATTTMKMSG